mgnify:CR=1 FL=1
MMSEQEDESRDGEPDLASLRPQSLADGAPWTAMRQACGCVLGLGGHRLFTCADHQACDAHVAALRPRC